MATAEGRGADVGQQPPRRQLRRSITLAQAVALYAGAVIGAGVLILPGVGAGEAGPASLLAWIFDGLLGVPIALTFAAMAARFPDAGGVATFVTRAFGVSAGTVVGWSYFVAAAVAQALVVLTGGHYAADALHLGRPTTFAFAATMLALAVAANLFGMRLSARLQLFVAAAVALVLIAATVAAIPHVHGAALTPFMPDGWRSVGRAAILLFFAFFGWEAITHLASEFNDPARDLPRATVLAAGLVTSIYLGVAFAVVATGTYGTGQLDRVAVAHVLAGSLGVSAKWVAATAAVVIPLGTANAFVAATSRLGYALGRDGALPTPMARLSGRDVPDVAIVVVGAIASSGLLLAYVEGWGAEAFLVVPNSLVIVVYVVAMTAGVRLLDGVARLVAALAALLCLAILPFAGVSLAIPVGVAVASLLYATWSRRRGERRRHLPVRVDDSGRLCGDDNSEKDARLQ
jgi:amino acid efflux transporter